MSRTVTGTLLLPNGQPMANARIFFTAKRTEAVSIVEGVNTFFSTGSNGAYSQSIVNGWYSVSIEWDADIAGSTVRRWKLGDAFVEDGAATTLEALLIASNPDVSVDVTLLYEVLEQAQQAAQNAQASAVAAAASAASVTPTTGPNDTTPGHLWRTDDLVKTVSGTDTANGSIPVIRAEGIFGVGNIGGAQNLPSTGPGSADAQTIPTGMYLAAYTSFAVPPFGTAVDVYLDVHRGGAIHADQTAHAIFPFPRKASRAWQGGSWSAWREEWNNGNLVKTTFPTDATPGSMLQVGAGGLLSSFGPAFPGFTAPKTVGWYYADNIESFPGAPEGATGPYIVRLDGANNLTLIQNSTTSPNRAIYQGVSISAEAAPANWIKYLHTGNTSADVQAMLGAANNAAIRAAIRASSLPPYTLGTVPSAPANANLLIIITDLSSGREPCFSNGSDWLRCSDKSIVN